MFKNFIKITLFLLLFVILFFTYLSIYGISTDRFNNLISQKITERDKNLNINLNKIKIFLNISEFNLELKTNKPKVFFKNNEIKIKSISTDLPLKSLFSKKINFKEIKILTDKNKIQKMIKVARNYKNNPQLFFLNKIIKDGFISMESRIMFEEDGSIKDNYLVDGNIEDLKLELLNENLIDNINFSFIIKKKEYLIYNLSSLYQSAKIKSNQIKIINIKDNYVFEGDISNQKSEIDLDNFSSFFK